MLEKLSDTEFFKFNIAEKIRLHVDTFASFNANLLIIVVIFIVVGVVFWLWFPAIKRHLVNRNIRNQIKKLGNKIITNVHVPDDIDGDVVIDYIVVSNDKVIVVDVKRYDGLIYGNETLDKWTQVVNSKNYQFANPLIQMKGQVMTVQSIVPAIHVEGVVIFAGQSSFPTRIPEGVLKLGDISNNIKQSRISDLALVCWQELRRFQR